jgi:hypothetical protein
MSTIVDYQLAATHREAILATLGPAGRMIAASKTAYREDNPDHLTVFNANVCLGRGKVWWGDIDLTLDESLLLDLAAEAVYSASPSGRDMVDATVAERRDDGRLYIRALRRPPQGEVTPSC